MKVFCPIPRAGNLSLGKGLGGGNMLGSQSRRAVPNFGYSNHDASGASYPKNKGTMGSMTKRQGMGAVSHAKGYSNKPGVPPGLIGQVAVAGHKMAPVPNLTEPSGGVPGQGGYKFKANAGKAGGGGGGVGVGSGVGVGGGGGGAGGGGGGGGKYVSPYSLKQLAAGVP